MLTVFITNHSQFMVAIRFSGDDIDLPNLKTLFIGRYAFSYTDEFNPMEFPNLEDYSSDYYLLQRQASFELRSHSSIKSISFLSSMRQENALTTNYTKSFRITNCYWLESLSVGQMCFYDYGGQFEISSCHSLESLSLGYKRASYNNFEGSSFIVRGKNLFLILIL